MSATEEYLANQMPLTPVLAMPVQQSGMEAGGAKGKAVGEVIGGIGEAVGEVADGIQDESNDK